MARRAKRYVDPNEDDLAGLFPGLMRGPGGIPLPPPNPATTLPSGGGGGGGGGGNGGGGGDQAGTQNTPSAAADAAAKRAAAKKAAAAKTASSSTGSSSYDKYLAQQRADANKTKNKAANKYINSAEALQGQARALRALLGLPLGRKGDPFKVKGGMRTAGPNSKYGEHWESQWSSSDKSSGWTRPGQLRGGGLRDNGGGQAGVRTGTDIKYPPGTGSGGSGNTLPGGPKFPGGNQGGGGQGGGAGPGPRHGTQPPRNADTNGRRPFEDPHRGGLRRWQ